MTRHPTRRPATWQDDARQERVEQWAAELAAMCRALPHAIAADSAGVMTGGDRHATGGPKDSAPLPLNTAILSVAMRLTRQLAPVQVEAVAILNLERAHRDPLELIAALPGWHRALAARRQPLARHIHDDLAKWVRAAQLALGLRRPAKSLGVLCPDHRGHAPTVLEEDGDHATLARTLLGGPPLPRRRMVGPLCKYPTLCEHELCNVNTYSHHIARRAELGETRIDRRIRQGHKLTDWVLDPETDEVVWSSWLGDSAVTWHTGSTIRCPFCKRTWSTTSQQRLLARQLQALASVGKVPAIAVTA